MDGVPRRTGPRPTTMSRIRAARQQPVDLLAVPIPERRQIVVVPDDALSPQPRSTPLTEGKLRPLVVRARARLPHQVPGSTKLPVDGRLEAVDAMRADGIDIRPITVRQMRGAVVPVGHPAIGVVYVADPADPKRYWPAAQFHRRVFEHKFSEAARLLMALGATSMNIRFEHGWSGEIAAGLLAPLKKVAKPTLKISANAEHKSEMLLAAQLSPDHRPTLPEDMVWYAQEPSWRMVAEGRLHRGLNVFALNVESTDDYGITSEFEARLAKQKLFQLGGKFTAHKATKWVIEGEFAPMPSAGTEPAQPPLGSTR